MKKLTGLMVVVFFSFIERGSTFTLIPLNPVIATVATRTATVAPIPPVNIPFSVVAMVYHIDPITFQGQIIPCANGQATVTVNTPSGPVSVSGPTNSQGNATLTVSIPISSFPFNSNATAMAVCPNPPYGNANGMTTGINVQVVQPGMQSPIYTPILAQ